MGRLFSVLRPADGDNAISPEAVLYAADMLFDGHAPRTVAFAEEFGLTCEDVDDICRQLAERGLVTLRPWPLPPVPTSKLMRLEGLH